MLRPSGYVGYAGGYAAKARGYVSYAVTRGFLLHMCACTRVCVCARPHRMDRIIRRNRVTHVTTRVSRVTAA